MLIRACVHGFVIFLVAQFGSIVLQASVGPDLELTTPMDAILQSSMQWMAFFTTVGAWVGLGSVFLSFGLHVLTARPAPGQSCPTTWRDQFALAAEQDSAILYAKHVLRFLDEAIANRWPDQQRKG